MSDKIERCLSCDECIKENDNIFYTEKGYFHEGCVNVVPSRWLLFDKRNDDVFEESETDDAEVAFLELDEERYIKEL